MAQTKIGELLHEDHVATLEILNTLEAFLASHRRMPPTNAVTQDMLRRLAATLREEVEKHFGFEENYVFPVFLKKGVEGIVMMLTHEHRTILPLALRVAEGAVQAAEAGFTEETWRDFADCGAELVEREVFHIQKEEMGLLGAISALVDSVTDEELVEIYQRTFA